ncbi:uncharacterized protein LOC120916805 [Rana temporaria]|uniref:uncharacterized protein LOC120916805 n=1 Tax=Rana temporaria TaxID=8407 RepID=UPI001AAD549C|nr:uncharacterized protein LOC120916805 [Rana temporaria]
MVARGPNSSGSGTAGRSVGDVGGGVSESGPRARTRSPSVAVASGSGLGRGGRSEQQPGPSASRSRATGTRSEDASPARSAVRSEGELSGSESGEDSGHLSAVDGGAAARGPSPRQPDGEPCLVWIFGHSYVSWGARRAEVRPTGRQLGIPTQDAKVRWIGFPGMMWGRVLPEVLKFTRLDRAPDILLLHVGGNDMGSRSMHQLIRDIKCDFLRLRSLFPGMVIIWSEMVGRSNWRWAWSVDKVNKARVKVNKEVGRFVVRNGGLVVRHRELEEETWRFLRSDGVHLNPIGIDLWALGLEEGVRRALSVWRCTHG